MKPGVITLMIGETVIGQWMFGIKKTSEGNHVLVNGIELGKYKLGKNAICDQAILEVVSKNLEHIMEYGARLYRGFMNNRKTTVIAS